FPSTVFSGHEKMALKILEKAPYKVNCILNEKLISKFTYENQIFGYHNLLVLLKTLLKIRFRKRHVTIIIIAGSPYGFLLEKILLKMILFKLIDYVPFPELKIMQDRFHHKLIPFFNKLLISERVLIDEWQLKYSAVKKSIVIKNIVGND
ncbi:hypothetical protein B0A80_17670, partial [Flavobacterium tructae]|uniref:hypothetical protein n=1 Tax=Flavobacterium tructae TaxID=1114873 RepID=UPI000B665358